MRGEVVAGDRDPGPEGDAMEGKEIKGRGVVAGDLAVCSETASTSGSASGGSKVAVEDVDGQSRLASVPTPRDPEGLPFSSMSGGLVIFPSAEYARRIVT